MPVEFKPVTNAWLGASYPLRAKEAAIYNNVGDYCRRADPTAELHIYAYEMNDDE